VNTATTKLGGLFYSERREAKGASIFFVECELANERTKKIISALGGRGYRARPHKKESDIVAISAEKTNGGIQLKRTSESIERPPLRGERDA